MAHQESPRYVPASIPADEELRLDELNSLRILDTAAEARFDRYTHLIADIFDFPIALVTLVDRDRLWFKSAFGLEVREAGREASFCAHAIHQSGMLEVEDARADPRFADNPLVTGEPGIRFYAGVVVRGPEGRPMGTLCVIDRRPRRLTDKQRRDLRGFAELVEQELHHSYELDRLRSQIEFSAYFDPLTNLPNRRLLIDRTRQLLALSEATGNTMALLLFNVDRLRLINQSMGTDAGDNILQQVADRLQQVCPSGGTVARLQGDEFVMLVPYTSPEGNELDTIVNRARARLARPFVAAGQEFRANIRMGGSVFPQDGATPDRLIERAAAAIRYMTPGDAAEDVHFFTESEAVSLSERLRIESRLRRALDEKAFHVLYQPIVALDTGRMVGTEALIRWQDSELGLVPPERFIPVAEETGIIIAIDRWMLGEVCNQLARWKRAGMAPLPAAVNVVAAELRLPNFADMVKHLLRNAHVAPEMLRLEITERCLLAEDAQAMNNLSALKAANIGLSLDDFGTGYSSLDYLRRVPISSLKIDSSFVHGLPHRPQDVTLTRAILDLARNLSLGTVAEGVETQSQLDFLRGAGCGFSQGDLLSRPVSADRIAMLAEEELI